jgi:hypothetical protein
MHIQVELETYYIFVEFTPEKHLAYVNIRQFCRNFIQIQGFKQSSYCANIAGNYNSYFCICCLNDLNIKTNMFLSS